MAAIDKAAHILSKQYPELTTDAVSQYVTHLKKSLGPARSSAVYSMACRAAPVGDNPLGIKRGSIVEIEGERFIVLGCGFMTLELASLLQPEKSRTIGADEFVKLLSNGIKVLESDETNRILNSLVNKSD